MAKIVDIYLPLDARKEPNAVVWPVATEAARRAREGRSGGAAGRRTCSTRRSPCSSVAEGMRVIRKAKGSRFINFIAGWAYPDFSVRPMAQLPPDAPKLMLGSTMPDFPGAVGLLAAASGTDARGHRDRPPVCRGLRGSRGYEDALAHSSTTATGRRACPSPSRSTSRSDRAQARKVKAALRGMVYGAVGPRSMQMWNKISEAHFLSVFGVARGGIRRTAAGQDGGADSRETRPRRDAVPDPARAWT